MRGIVAEHSRQLTKQVSVSSALAFQNAVALSMKKGVLLLTIIGADLKWVNGALVFGNYCSLLSSFPVRKLLVQLGARRIDRFAEQLEKNDIVQLAKPVTRVKRAI